MSILTQYPVWLLPLCAVAGLVYAGALYFRDRFNRTYGARLSAFLGALRFAAVTLLAFFLLRPVIRSTERVVEKPIVVIAQDNSRSLALSRDSAFYRSEYLSRLGVLEKAFGEEYDVRTLRFGDGVREGLDSISYTDKVTDLSALFEEIYARYSGTNLGAIIVASDGLYNKGRNPVYLSSRLNAPVYTIALGDTTVYRDLRVADIAVNRLAYLGNRFPVRIVAEARKASGMPVRVEVSRRGIVLHSQTITAGSDPFLHTLDFTLEANEVGLQKYSVQIAPVDGEVTARNNRMDFFIDVLDGRQQILILAQSPHPDVAAMRDALMVHEGYKTSSQLARNFKGNPSDYSLVIFHQLPGTGGAESELVRSFLSKGIPSLFVWGAQTDQRAFQQLGTGFSLENARPGLTDASGSLSENFSLFTLEDQISSLLPDLPPISLPFGDIRRSPGATTFIRQRVGRLNTDRPLIAFNETGTGRCGLIAGEGLWRWRLGAYQATGSHDAFNELMGKTARYLAAKEDKSLFRVQGARNFPENEPVFFRAEVYNESLEPVSDREIRMTIRNDEGEEYNYLFSSAGNSYQLNAGNLPVGNYTYSAQVAGAAALPRETGEFSVSPLQLESSTLVADHRIMNQIATAFGGAMVTPGQMSTLPEQIRGRSDLVSVSYETRQLSDLINIRWILALLVGLLSLEWLLRKRAGTY